MYTPHFRLRKLASAIALASLCGASTYALAQEELNSSAVELDTVAVTAESAGQFGYIEMEEVPTVGKMNVPISEQPFSMSVVDEEFIQDSGAQNIQEALLYLSLIHISEPTRPY